VEQLITRTAARIERTMNVRKKELKEGEKAEHYRRIQQLAEEFKAVYGTINCGELLKDLSVNKSPVPEKRTEEYYKARPCIRFVETAAEILDKYIAENPL
jgi:hypothetical protein